MACLQLKGCFVVCGNWFDKLNHILMVYNNILNRPICPVRFLCVCDHVELQNLLFGVFVCRCTTSHVAFTGSVVKLCMNKCFG